MPFHYGNLRYRTDPERLPPGLEPGASSDVSVDTLVIDFGQQQERFLSGALPRDGRVGAPRARRRGGSVTAGDAPERRMGSLCHREVLATGSGPLCADAARRFTTSMRRSASCRRFSSSATAIQWRSSARAGTRCRARAAPGARRCLPRGRARRRGDRPRQGVVAARRVPGRLPGRLPAVWQRALPRRLCPHVGLRPRRLQLPVGEWRTRVPQDGTPLDDTTGGPWKAPYHSGRSLLGCTRRLAELDRIDLTRRPPAANPTAHIMIHSARAVSLYGPASPRSGSGCVRTGPLGGDERAQRPRPFCHVSR